jgi:hypothetical protein
MFKICLLTDIYQHAIQHDKFIEAINYDKDIIKEKYNIEVILWGPGIENEPINWSTPVEEKIEKTFGDKFYFDVILQLPGGGVLDTSFYSNTKTLVMIHFLEVPNNLDKLIIERVNPHLIFYISNENALNLFYSKKYTNKIIASFPMYHSEYLAKKYYNTNKTIDLLLVGNLSEDIYPLRSKIFKIINSDKLKKYNIVIRPNYGYANYSVDHVLNSNGAIYKESTDQMTDYLQQINMSKLVLCTSHVSNELTGVYYSTFRLRKYAEIGMSSALRIGDPSDEDYYNLHDKIVDVSSSDEDTIVEKIIYYIENDDIRDNMVKLQNNGESEFTCGKYVEKIKFAYNMYMKQQYGFYNFTQFRLQHK